MTNNKLRGVLHGDVYISIDEVIDHGRSLFGRRYEVVIKTSKKEKVRAFVGDTIHFPITADIG